MKHSLFSQYLTITLFLRKGGCALIARNCIPKNKNAKKESYGTDEVRRISGLWARFLTAIERTKNSKRVGVVKAEKFLKCFDCQFLHGSSYSGYLLCEKVKYVVELQYLEKYLGNVYFLVCTPFSGVAKISIRTVFVLGLSTDNCSGHSN